MIPTIIAVVENSVVPIQKSEEATLSLVIFFLPTQRPCMEASVEVLLKLGVDLSLVGLKGRAFAGIEWADLLASCR